MKNCPATMLFKKQKVTGDLGISVQPSWVQARQMISIGKQIRSKLFFIIFDAGLSVPAPWIMHAGL